MALMKSFFYNVKEAKYNPIALFHSSLYLATVTYLRALKNLLKFNSPQFRNHIAETYHSKVVRLEDASRFITINRDLEIRNTEQVLPWKHATDIVLKNPQNVVAYECACRPDGHLKIPHLWPGTSPPPQKQLTPCGGCLAS